MVDLEVATHGYNVPPVVDADGAGIGAMLYGGALGTATHDVGVLGYVRNGGTGVKAIGQSNGLSAESPGVAVVGRCTAQGGNLGTGVYGFATDGYGWGVIGRSLSSTRSTDLGVGFGVLGESGAGVGVQGNAPTGKGVVGTSTTGNGVYGSSGAGDAVKGEITNSGSTASGVVGTTVGGGAGVWGDMMGTGYAGVLGRTLTAGRGVYGQAWEGTGEGVYGEVIPTDSTAAAVHGVTNGTGPGVMGESKGGGYGVYGIGHQGAGVWGTSAGTGVWGDLTGPGYAGVLGRTYDDKTGGRGVYGQVWKGRGEGVYGEIVPTGNGSAAVHGHTNGSGPGVLGESVQGRGIVASGNVAQLQLKPSNVATHPTNGEAGDLLVDKSIRLWFCQGGGQWTRIA